MVEVHIYLVGASVCVCACVCVCVYIMETSQCQSNINALVFDKRKTSRRYKLDKRATM